MNPGTKVIITQSYHKNLIGKEAVITGSGYSEMPEVEFTDLHYGYMVKCKARVKGVRKA